MSQNSMGHSHQATLAGVVVRLPATFDECPDFVTLEMLSDRGTRVEVFLDRRVAAGAGLQLGQRLWLRNAARYVEPSVDGAPPYIRAFPEALWVDSPARA